ncbi:hypothetical protein [Salinigranum sp. GCM10025319]|uniref:hypothetical protein n=1 Tax=Salinigranum sp. GCM10025319 TaxID=3252687 RepID=UPI00361DD6B8
MEAEYRPMRLRDRAIRALRDGAPIRRLHRSKEFVEDRVRERAERSIQPKYLAVKYRTRYGRAAPRVDRLIRIDPADVDHLLSPHFWNRVSIYTTHVRGGEWDRNYTDEQVILSGRHEGMTIPSLIGFDNYLFFRGCTEHFDEGVPWEDTELYGRILENRDLYWDRYDSKAAIDNTLAELDRLYDSMTTDGYLQQGEIRGGDERSLAFHDTRSQPVYHEIAVDIGRDGEVVFDDGKHRFVVARVAGLSDIPVRVLVRHEEWQDVRSEISRAGSPDELSSHARSHLGHPDLDHLFPDSWL